MSRDIIEEYDGKYFGFPGVWTLPVGNENYWQNDHFGKIISIVRREPNFKFYLLGARGVHETEKALIVTYRTLGPYSEIRQMRVFESLFEKAVIRDDEDDMFDSVRLLKELGEFI